jgi:hypothetical protein
MNNHNKTKWHIFAGLMMVLAVTSSVSAQNNSVVSMTVTAISTNNLPAAPANLPGGGLAQHDFVYAGETKAERMYIVCDGQIVWDYTHPAKGEISDAVLEPNGNILFAHQFCVTEVSADKKVLWT